jgi:hypothetical protein
LTLSTLPTEIPEVAEVPEEADLPEVAEVPDVAEVAEVPSLGGRLMLEKHWAFLLVTSDVF